MKRIINKIKDLTHKKYFRGFFFLGIIILTTVFHIQHILNPDEGVLLNGAWQMINGSTLYLDIFSYIAPFGYYLIYWLWSLLGVSYLMANLFSIILLVISAFILFESSQQIKKTSLNYLVPLIYIISTAWLPLINHNFFSSFFAVLSTHFFLKYINNKRSVNIIFTALFTGITVITLQQKGLAIAGVTTLFLFLFINIRIKEKIKHISLFILSFILPLLFLLFWPLSLIFNNLIYFPFFNYRGANIIPLNDWIMMVTVLIIISFKYFKSKRKKIYYLLALQLVLFISILPLPDSYHLLLSVFPLLILIPSLLSFKKIKHTKEKIYFIVIISFILAIILIPILNYKLVFRQDTTLKNNIEGIVDDNCKSDYIYVGPFIPNLYFELRKLNPSSYDILLTKHHTKEQFQEAKENIIEKKPDCAILSYPASLKRFNYDKNNLVDTYIKENYILISNELGINLYKNK